MVFLKCFSKNRLFLSDSIWSKHIVSASYNLSRAEIIQDSGQPSRYQRLLAVWLADSTSDEDIPSNLDADRVAPAIVRGRCPIRV